MNHFPEGEITSLRRRGGRLSFLGSSRNDEGFAAAKIAATAGAALSCFKDKMYEPQFLKRFFL